LHFSSVNLRHSTMEIGDFRTLPATGFAHIYVNFANKDVSGSCGTVEIGDFRALPANGWAKIFNDFTGDDGLKTGSFRVPDDLCRTPQGPKITSGKCLAFLAAETPGNSSFDDECAEEVQTAAVNRNCFEYDIATEVDTDDMEKPQTEPSKGAGLAGHSAWMNFPAARAVSEQAQRAKEQVSEQAQKAKEQVQKSLGYMKEQSESVLRMQAQMQKYALGKAETAREMPAQMQRYALGKAETAREKAHAVSAAVTARVSQSAQKGLDMAMSMRAPQTKSQHGGA